MLIHSTFTRHLTYHSVSARSANNPDEWHNFFKFKFDVNPVVVTCSLDNDLLIRTLVERRECFRKIELLVDANESVDDANLAKMAAQIERERSPIEDFKASLYPGIPELYARLVALNGKVLAARYGIGFVMPIVNSSCILSQS